MTYFMQSYNPILAPTPIVAMQCNAEDGIGYFRGMQAQHDELPDNVKEEMRRHDINFAKMIPSGILTAIEESMKYDMKLMGNPDGVTILDKIRNEEPAPRKPKKRKKSFAEMVQDECDRVRHQDDEHEHEKSFSLF